MAIVAGDLVAFASANMPDTDAALNGGAIDLLRRVDFTQIAADDDIEVVSSAAGDTQNCTITARNAAGAIVTETKALTGTTAAIFSTLGVVERVLQVELASAAVGAVTVRRSVAGATLRTIPATERGFMALFRKCASDPAVQKDYFTKIFLKNTHATLSLLSAAVKQNADPDARITHLLAAAVNDSATTANRVTAPAAGDTQDPDTFDDTDKNVPGTDLAAGAAIGVWLRLRLPAADAPHRSTYTIELAGQST
jgi:hypothetical protein